MATLNIKQFPDELYERLRGIAAREHRSVSQQVVHLLEQATTESQVHSILELRGLGKEHWLALDAAGFVERERRSWD